MCWRCSGWTERICNSALKNALVTPRVGPRNLMAGSNKKNGQREKKNFIFEMVSGAWNQCAGECVDKHILPLD